MTDFIVNVYVPYRGRGILTVPRKAKVSLFVDKFMEREITGRSSYFLGPRGSGKEEKNIFIHFSQFS